MENYSENTAISLSAATLMASGNSGGKRMGTTIAVDAVEKEQLATRIFHWPRLENCFLHCKAPKGFAPVPKTTPSILKTIADMTRGARVFLRLDGAQPVTSQPTLAAFRGPPIKLRELIDA